MKSQLYPFHLAMPVTSVEKAMYFYEEILGLKRGRFSDKWVDYDFFGHQVVFHEVQNASQIATNPVDGEKVPVPHFGLALDFDKWEQLAQKFKEAKVEFIIEPTTRFKGGPGEQGTFFIKDPNGLCIEFKAFKDPSRLFFKG